MIQMGTVLDVADNSGAKKIACISLLGGFTGRYGSLGDVISASVKEAAPDGTVKKGEVVRAVIDRLAKVKSTLVLRETQTQVPFPHDSSTVACRFK